MMRPSYRQVAGCVVLVLATAAAAAAQQPAPPSGVPAGPLVVERVESGWLIAPDARAADLDGQIGSLAGVYGGRITDRTWLVGGGGYWLTNRENDFKMAYGGAVVEWLVRTDRPIGFGVRTLVGAGSATLPRTLGDLVSGGVIPSNSRPVRFGSHRLADANTRIAVRDDFFIAEPQLNVLWNFGRRYRISVGVGYRLIGVAPALGEQLEGLSGSIAFHIGAGS